MKIRSPYQRNDVFFSAYYVGWSFQFSSGSCWCCLGQMLPHATPELGFNKARLQLLADLSNLKGFRENWPVCRKTRSNKKNSTAYYIVNLGGFRLSRYFQRHIPICSNIGNPSHSMVIFLPTAMRSCAPAEGSRCRARTSPCAMTRRLALTDVAGLGWSWTES